MTETLFPIAADEVANTSDEFYTPRWVFNAMGLRFDLDAAAPPGGPWHVPADRWYTVADDGRTAPWDGLVWCNPPFSGFAPWAERWAAHPTGVLLGPCTPESLWFPTVVGAADAVAFIGPYFDRPVSSYRKLERFTRVDAVQKRPLQKTLVAFRGVGVAPAERLAAADPTGGVLYGPRGRP